ncbi:hypothetical protein WMY93_024132 [Mugilogobius chulae]|uniref:Uncharacterized protein n=1 Tax=Mugilogobius chulae TaxID=88201 RepID=A0AAW0N690_9GOBI
MHGLPCASLGSCFDDPSEVNVEPSQELDISLPRVNSDPLPAEQKKPVVSQPKPTSAPKEEAQNPEPRTVSYVADHSKNGQIQNVQLSEQEEDVCLESSVSLSVHSEEEDSDYCPEVDLSYPQIPRPSIIRYTEEDPDFQDSDFQETWWDQLDYGESENGELSGTETWVTSSSHPSLLSWKLPGL